MYKLILNRNVRNITGNNFDCIDVYYDWDTALYCAKYKGKTFYEGIPFRWDLIRFFENALVDYLLKVDKFVISKMKNYDKVYT